MLQKSHAKILSIVLATLLVSGCASLSSRTEYANDIAEKSGFVPHEITAGDFILTTYAKIRDKKSPVTIYIEGDGFARASYSQASFNPTPKDAFTLQLAAVDPAANVVYIARPCQYTDLKKDKSCATKYWAGSRFSEQAVSSVNSAISYYAKQLGNAKINLVGYSGGAAIAVLVAARRNDITSLRTVAGNLDHEAVNQFHKVDSLDDSLNPIDVAEKLANLPQYHFAGAADEIIPLSAIESFAKKSERGMSCVKVSTVAGATHDAGWLEHWQFLLKQPVSCNNKIKAANSEPITEKTAKKSLKKRKNIKK